MLLPPALPTGAALPTCRIVGQERDYNAPPRCSEQPCCVPDRVDSRSYHQRTSVRLRADLRVWRLCTMCRRRAWKVGTGIGCGAGASSRAVAGMIVRRMLVCDLAGTLSRRCHAASVRRGNAFSSRRKRSHREGSQESHPQKVPQLIKGGPTYPAESSGSDKISHRAAPDKAS